MPTRAEAAAAVNEEEEEEGALYVWSKAELWLTKQQRDEDLEGEEEVDSDHSQCFVSVLTMIECSCGSKCRRISFSFSLEKREIVIPLHCKLNRIAVCTGYLCQTQNIDSVQLKAI